MRYAYHLPVIVSVGSLVGYTANYDYGVDLIVIHLFNYGRGVSLVAHILVIILLSTVWPLVGT